MSSQDIISWFQTRRKKESNLNRTIRDKTLQFSKLKVRNRTRISLAEEVSLHLFNEWLEQENKHQNWKESRQQLELLYKQTAELVDEVGTEATSLKFRIYKEEDNKLGFDYLSNIVVETTESKERHEYKGFGDQKVIRVQNLFNKDEVSEESIKETREDLLLYFSKYDEE